MVLSVNHTGFSPSSLLNDSPQSRGVGKVITLHDITNLKQLDRMKSDFVSTVSHDLRSPLTAILGYIELIKRVGPLNVQQKDFAEGPQDHSDYYYAVSAK